MSKYTAVVVASVVLLAGAAGYWFWLNQQAELTDVPMDEPIHALVEVPPEPDEAAPPTFPLKQETSSPAEPPLPALDQSDAFVTEALNTLLANPELAKVFIAEKFIEKFVATIDNLSSKTLPVKVLPIKTADGMLVTMGSEDTLAISPQNAERYAPYMSVLNAADTRLLVQLYLRLYPLMQQAYEDLGYPEKYFNDRLIEVIDHLLAAPNLTTPIKLVQPLVVYKFADPYLEKRSIGQRIMMRIGSHNEAMVKLKLIDIKRELEKHIEETRPR
ncbi:MAG: DUF3014 domain-containing protein [Gammaproteobacteria bacterium]|nr:MAG: DUF3014 domain-containing protein [Gammaproteobacteria bacterium]